MPYVSLRGETTIPEEVAEGLHDKTTHHKALLPLNGRDIGGFILAAVGLAVAAGGGIGGGAILVPIFTLVVDFDSKFAIPLANVSVFGGSIANVLLNFSKRHPDADRPLIDWNLILMMEPLTIAGALIGALINKVLPSDILVIMLVVVLSITADRTLRKARKIYDKENEEQRIRQTESSVANVVIDTSENLSGDPEISQNENHPKNESERDILPSSADSLTTPLLDEVTKNNVPKNIDPEVSENDLSSESKLQEILEEEQNPPVFVVSAIVVLFLVVVVLNVLKGGGGKTSPIGIKCGSLWFWLIQMFMFMWIIVIAFIARLYMLGRTKLKKEANYSYVEGDAVWDERSTLVYPAICSVAGLCAGMFGIGGGIVKGPLMLAMGVHPKVTAATSATMILFTSFTATTSFVVFGLLQFDYAYVMLVIGFLATLVGQTIMNELVRKTGRNSYIVYLIGIVVLVSTIAMVLKSIFSVEKATKGDSDDRSFCAKGA